MGVRSCGASVGRVRQFRADELVEAAGIEPAFQQSKELTTSGQNGLNSGQPLSLGSGPDVKQRRDSGQTESNTGRNLTPKRPPRNLEPNTTDEARLLCSELSEVVSAWDSLPRPLKDGILAMLRSQAK